MGRDVDLCGQAQEQSKGLKAGGYLICGNGQEPSEEGRHEMMWQDLTAKSHRALQAAEDSLQDLRDFIPSKRPVEF